MPVFLSAVAAAVLLAILAALAAFVRWRSRTIQQLLSASTIVQTSRGPIDCAFTGPEGAPAVLVLHGGLGGWDQAIALAEDLGLTERFRIIAPSRPGYLRTPLQTGSATDQAADAMIALLDALEVAAAAVVGLSGGGPTALAIATRHPHRTRALAMICAISHHHRQPAITTESFFGRVLFSSAGAWLLDLGSWIAIVLTRVAPAFMTRRILRMTELVDPRAIRRRVRELRNDPRRLRWVLRLLEHSFPISPRKAGLNNDLAQFASLSDRIGARITCPTLVVHGRIDGNVPVAHAEAVMAVADRAEVLLIDDASHLLWLHPRSDEIGARLRAFLDAEASKA